VFGWTGDGKGLYFATSKPEDAWPRKIYVLDLATGKKSFWKGIAPSDPTGVGGIGPVPLIAAREVLCICLQPPTVRTGADGGIEVGALSPTRRLPQKISTR